jgi:membrane protease YdiL (CAAX protease family)
LISRVRFHPLLRCGLFGVFYYLFFLLLGPLPAVVAATGLMLLVFERRFPDFIGFSLERGWAHEFGAGLLMGGVLVGSMASAFFVSGQVTWEGSTGFAPAQCAAWAGLFLLYAAGEEMLFRGYGFQRLLEAAGPAGSVAVSSLLFGVVHLGNPGATTLGVVNTVVVGVFFALAYLRTRRLWLPIGLHWAWNLAEAMLGFRVSGIRIEGMPLVATPVGQPRVIHWITGGSYGPEGSFVGTVVIAAGIGCLLLGRRRAGGSNDAS